MNPTRDRLVVFALFGVLFLTSFHRALAPSHGADEGDDRYRYVVGLLERGLTEMAVEEAQGFLRDFPAHPKIALARYRLGNALFDLDKPSEALAYFERLASDARFEYRAESAFRLGECSLRLDRAEEARRAFESVLGMGAEYLRPSALRLLGETALRAKDPATARARFEELLAAHPDSDDASQARRALGWCALEQGDSPAALAAADACLARTEDAVVRAEIMVLKGEALMRLSRPQEALAAFQAARGHGSDDLALRGEGFARAALGDRVAAARAFGTLVQDHPASPHAAEAALQLGVQLVLAGDGRGALDALALPGVTPGPETRSWRARALALLGEGGEALAELDRALAEHPSSALEQRIQGERGDLLHGLGRSEEARRAWERAGSAEAPIAAAIEALSRGDARAAEAMVAPLVERGIAGPLAQSAQLVLAEALFAQEKPSQALALFEAVAKAAQAPGDRAKAELRAAWCLQRSGDARRAAQAFSAFARAHPESPEADDAAFLAARTLDDARASQEARGLYEDYLEGRPAGSHAPDALAALARLCALAGDAAAAEARWTELAEQHPEHRDAPRARYELAFGAYERGDHERASRHLANLLERELEGELLVPARELSVFVHAERGEIEAAVTAWRSLAEAGAGDERLLATARSVARAARARKTPAAAQPLFDELLRHGRSRDVAASALVDGAYLSLEAGEVDRAEASLRVAAKEAQKNASRDLGAAVAEACFFVAEAREQRGETERARELYRSAAVDGSPVQAQALYKLGFTALEEARLDDAVVQFERLVAVHPRSELAGESRFLLAEAHFRAGRLSEAEALLARVIVEHPEHVIVPKALFRRGAALVELGRGAEAEPILARLLRDFPSFPNGIEAQLLFGRALAQQKKSREARAALERVTVLDQGELAARARLALGVQAESEGKHEVALGDYLKVAVLYAHEESVTQALLAAGRCLERIGRVEQAAARYRELVLKHPESSPARAARERLAELERSN